MCGLIAVGVCWQITMSPNNMWGIIHMLVELFMKQEDGKYVMMKVSFRRRCFPHYRSPSMDEEWAICSSKNGITPSISM